MPTPMRTLQVAVTAAALLFAQAPASAQSPAPAPAPAATPAPPAEPAPAVPPPPTTDTRAPASELPTEPQPLPAWTPGPPPTPEQPPVAEPPGTPGTPETPLEPGTPPSDVAGPPVGPEPPPAAPVDLGKANKMRKSGSATMIAGGAIAVVGFGLTLGFTLRGNKAENDLVDAEDRYQKEDCSRMDSGQCDQLTAERDAIRDKITGSDNLTKIAGGVLAAGLIIAAAGGIVFRLGMKRINTANETARLRVSPTFGGLSLSGRF